MSLSPRNSPESLMLAKLPAEVHMWAAAYSLKLIVDDADEETRGLRMVLSDVDNARAFAKLVLDPHAAVPVPPDVPLTTGTHLEAPKPGELKALTVAAMVLQTTACSLATATQRC